MSYLIFSFALSFLITLLAIPPIVRLSNIKHIFDMPNGRKSHAVNTPTLGGVAIFVGLVSSILFCSSSQEVLSLRYIVFAILILFFIGLKDDLYRMVVWKKLVGQIFASFIMIHFGKIQILTFYGLFGINDLNLISSYLLTGFTIIVITNSFNLIDGVDCLGGAVAILASLVFGSWFFLVGATQYALLSFSLIGSLIAFLYFNRTPAKIFMGDTGSLMVGGILSLLAIQFIEMNRIMNRYAEYKVVSVPVVTIAILIIPLFDTLRIFIVRVLKNQSPFYSDRNHLHHQLLNLGFDHIQTTCMLIFFNILIMGLAFALQGIHGELLLLIIFLICLLTSFMLSQKVKLVTSYKNV